LLYTVISWEIAEKMPFFSAISFFFLSDTFRARLAWCVFFAKMRKKGRKNALFASFFVFSVSREARKKQRKVYTRSKKSRNGKSCRMCRKKYGLFVQYNQKQKKTIFSVKKPKNSELKITFST
jgi:hypothetical protein